jgi:hypothetical protein
MIRSGVGDCQFHDALANDEHTVAMYVAAASARAKPSRIRACSSAMSQRQVH